MRRIKRSSEASKRWEMSMQASGVLKHKVIPARPTEFDGRITLFGITEPVRSSSSGFGTKLEGGPVERSLRPHPHPHPKCSGTVRYQYTPSSIARRSCRPIPLR
eukprot:2701410-Prymnesium_polylepis.1